MTTPPSVDPVLLARAHASTIENARQLARLSPRGATLDEDGLVLIATGFPTAALNWAFVAERPADPHAALVAARAFFTRLGLPWRLVAWETLGAALAPIAAATGFSERPPEPGMLLAPLADSTPHTSVNLMVQPVADTATLRAYNDVFAAAFDLPTEGIDLVFNPAILAAPNATLLLGWADGKPVGIGLGLTSHHIAGIFAIGVLPAYRRRGFGEALTWDTVQSCGRGCLAAYLTTSPLGFPVYARMGFRHVGSYRRWADQYAPR